VARTGCSVLWLLLALLLGQPTAAESFKSAKLLPVSTGVDYVLSADLNGDGKPDLIYLPSLMSGTPITLRTPEVLLGNGDGTFAAAQAVPLLPASAGSEGKFAIADVNKDGKPDLIVVVATNTSNSKIAVFLGNGDGTFQPGIVSVGPSNTNSFPGLDAQMGIADFDGDGAVDIIVSDLANDTLSFLSGDNQGHFTLKNTWFDGNNPRDIHFADLNGDGNLDFVAQGGLSSSISVYLGNGNGAFKQGVTYTGPHFISSMVLNDINHDGHLDLVVSGFNNTVDILLGNGDGTFSNTSAGGSSYAGVGPNVVAVSDFDGDGTLDIAVASHNGIGILLGLGNLTYQAASEFPVGPFPYNLAIGDFNADGHIDYAVVTAGGIALLFGNAGGTLQSADAYDVGYQVTGAASGDFNGDKFPDVAVGVSGFAPRILLGKGDGTFTITPDQAQPTINLNTLSTTSVGDINGDHKLDLLISQGNAYLELGNGDGTFGALSAFSVPGVSATSFFTADFNNDGVTDLATFGNQSVIFLTAQPNHTYTQFTANLSSSSSLITSNLAFADVNHDGKIDAVVNSSTVVNNGFGGSVNVLLGNGDGTFAIGPVYATAFSAEPNFAIGDVDGDGNLDIITSVGNPGNPTVQTGFTFQVLYANGDGTFQNPVSIATPHFVASVAAGDLDQDGIADLVFSDGNVVTVTHGARNRTFGPPRDYLAGDSPVDPMLIDLNGDGALDLVFANSETNNVSTATILLNLGVTRGTLTATPSLAVYGQPILLSASFAGTVAAAGLPTGSVSFLIDNAATGAAPLQNGTASFNDALLTPPGTHAITANWTGDDTFNPHNLSGQVVVNKADTSTTLSSAPLVAVIGQTVSVIARVVPPFQGVPTGTIQFQPGSGSPSSATLDSAASASLGVDTSKLTLGAYSYTANYSGDANFNPRTSTAVQFKVTDFALAVDPGSLTVTAGGSGNVNVSASSASGFNGTVDLSCSGLPSNARCGFAPASVSLAAAMSASSTLTVTTTRSAMLPLLQWQPPNRLERYPLPTVALSLAVWVFALFVLFGMRRRFMRIPLTLAVALFLGLIVCVFAGCGGRGSGGSGTPHVATYTVQVVGAVHGSAPTTSRSTTISVTIQQ